MHMRAILLCCLLNGGFIGSSSQNRDSCVVLHCYQCHVTADIYICSSNASITTDTDRPQNSGSGDSGDICCKGGTQNENNYIGNISSCHENNSKGDVPISSVIDISTVFGVIGIIVVIVVIYLLTRGLCMKDCAKQSDVTTREEARPIMAATGTEKFRDNLKNAYKDKYPTPLSQWCKDWFENSWLHAINENDDPIIRIKKYSDVLQEEFIKQNMRVVLNDRLFRLHGRPFCYHYILSQWVQGDFLSNCTVVHKNVSDQSSLKSTLENVCKGQSASDACENGHILVLLYGFESNKDSRVDLEELLEITKSSNVSVWSTENIFRYSKSKEAKSVVLQEKDHNIKESP